MITTPLVFLSLVSSLSGMGGVKEFKSIGLRIIFYTVLTTIAAATIALGLFLIINPSRGLVSTAHSVESSITKSGSYWESLVKIIPDNFYGSFINNNILGIVFLGMLIGLSILYLEGKQKIFLQELFSAYFAIFLKIMSLISYLIPIAIWAFSTLFFYDILKENNITTNLFWYTACVVAANLLQAIVILPLLLIVKGHKPIRVFRKMLPALTTAFFTKSSGVALPVTMKCVEELNVDKKISKICIPLCSVINMNACAGFILITTLFVSQLEGIQFTLPQMICWIFISTLGAIGNASVPMGCYFITSAFLIGMGVPIKVMGTILPIYSILDMIETAVNVWSDACISVLVDKDIIHAKNPKIE